MGLIQKTIYRDNASKRLIPKKEAEVRDPTTWTQEQVTVHDPRRHINVADNVASVQEQYLAEAAQTETRGHGDDR